jgi:hypothetical protein
VILARVAVGARPGCCNDEVQTPLQIIAKALDAWSSSAAMSSSEGENLMRSETQLGLEGWFPQRAAVLTALGLWTAGFALGGASAWRMHHASAATDDGNEPSSWAEAAPRETPTDTAEPQGTLFMPVDVIVGGNTPATGAMLMQKP